MTSTAPFSLAPSADLGFRNASSYDQHRPSFPHSAVSSLLQHLEIATQASAKVVEIGAGTGKFTEILAARDEGYEIVAVEPHAGMRGILENKGLGDPGKGKFKVVDGNAAKMGVVDDWADACIVAQAFHWFANKEALEEIHRVLRPGATLGVIWNVEDYNAPEAWQCSTQWEQKMKNITWSFDDGVPRFRHQRWKDVFEAQVDSTPLQALVDTFNHDMPKFSLPLGEEVVKWTVWLPDEAVWERYLTLSQIAVLERDDKERVKRQVFEAMKGKDVERNDKGEVCVHGATYFAWTSRT